MLITYKHDSWSYLHPLICLRDLSAQPWKLNFTAYLFVSPFKTEVLWLTSLFFSTVIIEQSSYWFLVHILKPDPSPSITCRMTGKQTFF